MVAPIYISINSVGGFPFLHILSSTFFSFFFSFPSCVCWFSSSKPNFLFFFFQPNFPLSLVTRLCQLPFWTAGFLSGSTSRGHCKETGSQGSSPALLVMVILTGVRLQLTVVLIFISLLISDVEHLFMCFLAIYMSLWRNVYLDLLATFQLSYFLLLSCRSCLCVLAIDHFLVALYTNIISHSVDCFSFCLWFPLLCTSF